MQERVTCPTCSREVTTTRTSGKCEDGQYRAHTITRRHKNPANIGTCFGGIISIDIAINA